MSEIKQYSCLLKDTGTSYGGGTHISVTLRARDWKGLDNYGSNGVLVKRKVKTNDGTKQVNKPKT
jgi:hypothetical protein